MLKLQREQKYEKIRKAKILLGLYDARRQCEEQDSAGDYNLKKYITNIIEELEREFTERQRLLIQRKGCFVHRELLVWNELFAEAS